MIRMLLAWVLTVTAGMDQPTSEDLETYRSAQAEAGRDVDKHIKLALWCESHAMPTERLKHLATAVLIDPDHAVARGLLGQVSDQGKWRKPEAVSERVLADAKLAETLAEYQGRREKTP